MSWKQTITDGLADILRFLVRGALIVDGILLSIATVYVTGKLCWFTVQWLDRVLFASPW